MGQLPSRFFPLPASRFPLPASLRRQLPPALVRHLAHEPLRRVDIGEEQPVAERRERDAEHAETLGGSRVERRKPMLLRKPVLGRELKAAPAHLLEVPEIRSSALPPAL